MTKRSRWSIGALGILLCACTIGSGCIGGTKTMPLYVLYRQSKQVERDYHMNSQEAEKAVIAAFGQMGWTYRYSTNVGEEYTLYGRTECRQHVVVDIDPKKGRYNEVKIDVMIGKNGDFNKEIKFHDAISGGGSRLVEGKDGKLVVKASVVE